VFEQGSAAWWEGGNPVKIGDTFDPNPAVDGLRPAQKQREEDTFKPAQLREKPQISLLTLQSGQRPHSRISARAQTISWLSPFANTISNEKFVLNKPQI